MFAVSACSFSYASAFDDLPTSDWHAYNPPEGEIAFAQHTKKGGTFTIIISESKKDKCFMVLFHGKFDGKAFTRAYVNGERVGETRSNISTSGIDFVFSRTVTSLPEAWKEIFLFSLKKQEQWKCGVKYDPTI